MEQPPADSQSTGTSTSAPSSDPKSETTSSVPETTVPVTTAPLPTLAPKQTELANPANWDVKWQIINQGEILEQYQRTDTVSFGSAKNYFALPGVASFRGDNYRTGASYGTADVSEETFTSLWTNSVGSLNGWPGIGWTGQPLAVQWDEETKSHMNLYSSKKNKENLVEVIATTLDGFIYFYDLEDGSYTRDPLWLGMSVKGTASLDPRGYPILYVGSGLINNGKSPAMHIISLIDCSMVFERSGNDTFTLRDWTAFDSSPLIDAETDSLFWPGENGIIYTFKLNTSYDSTTGTLRMEPEEQPRVRYSTNKNRNVGYEDSAIIVDGYMYLGDNGGMFYCVDLNTLSLVWAQDTKDDVNATPVFEWGADGQGYIYTATSMEYGNGSCYIHKLNANTGEIIWTKTFDNILYDADVSGGILSSPVLGKKGTDLDGMIFYSVSKANSSWGGILIALDTKTGEVIWEKTMDSYCWSSPVGVYTETGKGYIIIGDSVGYIYLFNGLNGEKLYTEGLGSNIEASPVVFNDILVVGTRGGSVYGVRIN